MRQGGADLRHYMRETPVTSLIAGESLVDGEVEDSSEKEPAPLVIVTSKCCP